MAAIKPEVFIISPLLDKIATKFQRLCPGPNYQYAVCQECHGGRPSGGYREGGLGMHPPTSIVLHFFRRGIVSRLKKVRMKMGMKENLEIIIYFDYE
jgi:hypothetical protein